METGAKSREREAFSVDLSIQQLDEQIVTPWLRNRTFNVGGVIVKNRDAVKEVTIIHTERSAQQYFAQELAEDSQSGIVNFGASHKRSPFSQKTKTDHTHDLLFMPLAQESPRVDRSGTVYMKEAFARVSMRKILHFVLKTPSEFDAFCLDHFPVVHQKFSNGMDSTAKMNILLLEDLEHIYDLLKMHYSAEVNEYERKP